MTTDASIVRRSLAEPQTFGELFDRHAAVLHRFVARRTDAATADDVVAETFLVAFERRRAFDQGRDDALPWLFGIAVNLLRRHRRVDLRLLPPRDRDDERAGDGDPIGDAGRRIDAERELEQVLAAVRRMPAAHRETVLLHALAGLTYEQVAEAMEVPVGTVRSRLSRARAQLRTTSVRPSRKETLHGRDDAAPQLP